MLWQVHVVRWQNKLVQEVRESGRVNWTGAPCIRQAVGSTEGEEVSGEWTFDQLMRMAEEISNESGSKRAELAKARCNQLNYAGKRELAGILRSKYHIDITEVSHAG